MAMKKIHAQIARQKKLLLFTRNNRGWDLDKTYPQDVFCQSLPKMPYIFCILCPRGSHFVLKDASPGQQ